MRARHGVALLTALALLVMISIVALERVELVRPQRLVVAGIVDREVLESIALGGVEQARARLMSLLAVGPMQTLRAPAPLDAWSSAEGMVIAGDAGDLRYRLELHDDGGRLDINAATEDQFRKLLLGLRVDARRADHVAQAFADWRDADLLRRPNGAEKPEYLRAGRIMLPDDGPFASAAMLRFVMGMDDSLYRVIRPYVTTFGSGRIDLNAAAKPVLLTVPGFGEEAASLVVQYRRQGLRVTDLDRFATELSPAARSQLQAVWLELQQSVVLDTREVHVVSEAWRRESNARVRVDAVLSRDEEGRVVWRRVSP